MTFRAVLLPSLAGMLLAVVLGHAAAAEDDAAAILRFRRILAPEDRIKDWPLGDGKYLPVDAAEFERLVAAMQPRGATDPVAPTAAITSARHTARLVGDHLVGQTSAEVVLAGPAPAVLPLEPCNLALGKAFWDAKDSRRAALGLGDDGKLEALVERSGQLRFDWSLAGRRDSADVLGFLFEMPHAAASALSIDLPKGFTPALDRGVIVGSEPAGQEAHRWHIELGGCHRFRMRVLPAGVASRRPQLALLRESRTYDFSLHGVEVLAQWRLQVHNEPLQQITVLLDPGLQLVSARYGDTSLPWSAAPAADGQGTRVVLTLSEPICDTERVLHLVALGQLVLDRPWRLPLVRAEGLFWQEGSITLLTPEPLVTDRIVPLGCGQTGTGPLSAPRAGESLQFQAFEPDATVELSLSRRTATLQVLSAAAVERGGEEVTVRVAAGAATANRVSSQGEPSSPLKKGATAGLPGSAWENSHKNTAGQVSSGTQTPKIPQAASTLKAWAWNCHLESWYQSDGVAQHQATYDLQSPGHGRFRLTLPPDVDREGVRGIWIDGKPVAWQLAETEAGSRVTLELPAGRKFPCVAIQWMASGPRLGIVGSLAPPLPEPDLPVLARHWTAWLPPGYECLDSDARSASVYGSELTWSRRLFGPLGRAEGVDRFDPLSAGDWMSLVELRSREQTTETTAASIDPQKNNVGLVERPATAVAGGSAAFSTPATAVAGRFPNKGWTASRRDLPAGSPMTLGFVHSASMRLLGTIALLLMAAVGCWKAAQRPALLVSLLGGFGAAAIVLPDAYTPIASGGVLGILFCLAWRWVHPPVPPPAATSAPGSTVTMVVQLGWILLGALPALLAGGVARGETPPERADQPSEKRAAAPPMYRVLVPIDAKKKPTGGKVYVPEPLYQELYRRAAAPTEKPQGWLILGATYRGVLAAEAGSGRLAVDTLRAQYDLQVFGRATRVRVPLRAEGANLLPNGVLLDGRAIEPEWNPDATVLAFEVAEPGEYRLEVLLRPTMRGAVGPAGFDVAIPRVARSRLELTLPDDAPPVEVPSACGAVRVEKAPRRLSADRLAKKDPLCLLADLGPADRLTVRWHEGAASGTVGPAVDVEQLVWMKVQPGSVVIAAKFHLHVVEGQIQQVQLAVDPRLRLLPLPGDDPPTVLTGPESGESRLVALRWPHPISDQVTLETTFLLSGATGVGNFRLPRIELLDARPTKRWMAVSVDPALDGEQQQTQRLEAATVSDFLKAWGAADAKPQAVYRAKPQAAYRLPAGEIDWTISTRPHEPRSAADQTLTLLCDEDHVKMIFEAHVSTTSGYLFQHRLTAPAGLKIDGVSLLEGDVERASRWSQDADGAVTIFLGGAASGQQKLVLRGRLPIEAGKAWPLPQVRLQRCQLHLATIRLFRRPSVLVTTHGGQPQANAEPMPDDTAKFDQGRFVAAFAWAGSLPLPVTVTVEPNRPSASSQEGGVQRRQELPGSGAGFVRLADITMTWCADGSCCGAAAFDLEPGGAGECPLRLPDGDELVQVSVEGIPVAPKAVGDGTWRFPLASQRLPQRVEVLFRGSLPDADPTGRRNFKAPALGDLPIRQTLWTVIGPPTWVANEPEGVATVSDWRQELSRLESIAAAIESASAASSDDPDQPPRWHPIWTRRLVASRTALQRELATAGDGKEVARAKRQSDAIGQRSAKLADRLGTADALAPISAAQTVADGPAEILRRSPGVVQPAVQCAFEGWADSLTLDCREMGRPRLSHRLMAAAALAVLACLAAVGLACGTLTETLRRWPHATGVTLGLAWWLWLSPSVLGLGIALASVLAAGRERMTAKK